MATRATHGPDFPSSWALRFVRRLPIPLVLNPEQVVLNFAFVLIGATGFFAIDGSLLEQWQPPWIRYAWSLMMMVGGACVLYGIFKRHSTQERLGYLLTGSACAWFAVSALVYRGWPGLTVFGIFIAIAFIKVLRMLFSSAWRDAVIELGEKMDRDGD